VALSTGFSLSSGSWRLGTLSTLRGVAEYREPAILLESHGRTDYRHCRTNILQQALQGVRQVVIGSWNHIPISKSPRGNVYDGDVLRRERGHRDGAVKKETEVVALLQIEY
jgi:hypothetical protein